MKTRFVFLAALLALTFPFVSHAQIPRTLSYQGVLTNATGQPRPDGNYTFSFRLYTSPTGGTAIWSESKSLSVKSGLFSTALGEQTAFGGAVKFDQQYWLGIQVGNEPELSPRVALTSVGYSLSSLRADTARVSVASLADTTWRHSGANIYRMNGNVGIGTIDPISISGYGTSLNIADNAGGTLVLRDPNTTTGYRVKWFSNKDGILHYGRADDDGSSETIQMVIDHGGNVSIGTNFSPISISGYGTSLNIADNTGGTLVLRDPNTTTGYQVKWFSNKDGILHYGRASDDGSSVIEQMVIDQGGNVGIGTIAPISISGYGTSVNIANDAGGTLVLRDPNTTPGYQVKWFSNKDGVLHYGRASDDGSSVVEQMVIDQGGNVGIGTTNPTSKLEVIGTTTTKVLAITGGMDLAEPFEISENQPILKGALVIIDEENPGQLKLSHQAYDKRVAGVVSGAGGINPGLTLTQEGVLEDGQNVALSGRVYALATAANGPIKPGDLLTTSEVPGHAMKATDFVRWQGAVIGKAMSSLENGEGLVLVLVNLQ